MFYPLAVETEIIEASPEEPLLAAGVLIDMGRIADVLLWIDRTNGAAAKPVSVENLAEMVHMSRTSFYENFRDVMHVSPLQYAKSVKLHKAQVLIQEGKNAGEAGYMVGYNSPAQFSREYKRYFGYAPSATTVAL